MLNLKFILKNLILIVCYLNISGCATTSTVQMFKPGGAPAPRKNIALSIAVEDQRSARDVGYVGRLSNGSLLGEPKDLLISTKQSLDKQFDYYGYDITETENDLSIKFILDWIHVEQVGAMALIYMKAHVRVLDHGELVLDDFYEIRKPAASSYKIDALAAVDTGLQAIASQIVSDLDSYIKS